MVNGMKQLHVRDILTRLNDLQTEHDGEDRCYAYVANLEAQQYLNIECHDLDKREWSFIVTQQDEMHPSVWIMECWNRDGWFEWTAREACPVHGNACP